MKVRSWGLAIRLLAVTAAIYAFFSFRAQLEEQQQSPKGAIPVQVVKPTQCGTVVARVSPSGAQTTTVEMTPALKEALQNPGTPIAVRNRAACNTFAKLHGKVISVNNQPFTIEFKSTL